MSHIIPFNFNNHDVRVIERDGEPWFFAQDVAQVLGYSATGAMNKLIAEEDRQIQTFQNGTTYIKQTLINEAGLSTAIFNIFMELRCIPRPTAACNIAGSKSAISLMRAPSGSFLTSRSSGGGEPEIWLASRVRK